MIWVTGERVLERGFRILSRAKRERRPKTVTGRV